MSETPFPDFVHALPEAELPLAGLHGWLLQSANGQAIFLESSGEASVPAHAHGSQWGIVVAGQLELTIGAERHLFSRGDSYYIPAGTVHSARAFAGTRVLDVFADADRYRARV